MTLATPFRKILIANRGEIALRIMRTARRMGYSTVAVYSAADAGALHVAAADEAVAIGGALPSQSYLRIEAIVAAAKKTGADALHPGYGFLAENEDLAAACRDAGIVFIGPSPDNIAAMGNKADAKDIMARAGVPVVPGYQGADQSDAAMLREAERIGFPVMIKAVAGGGGRGMRLVRDAASFPDMLRNARSEAQGAFGDPTVILERAVMEPRHIEIQVFGDRHGNAIHLGERDCSVQRRHQKLIEEAPSPAVSPALRARMGEVAVAAVKAIGYEGAGTLEFLLDRDGHFYFMEMNTRLQVEHPVTEAITGLDLVELQLRVAAGEPLPIAQDDVRFSGHAIEVRLCAEDAGYDFMPQSGAMARWNAPDEVRVEHALRSGAEISPYYDSMIAKIVAYGASRDEARRRLIHALDRTVAFGVATNRDFLARCLRHSVFAAGEATTAFVAGNAETLKPAAPNAQDRALAAMLVYVTDPCAPPFRPGRSLAASFPMRLRFELAGEVVEADVVRLREGDFSVDTGGERQTIVLERLAPGVADIACDGVGASVIWHRDGDRLFVQRDGREFALRDLTRAPPKPAASAAGDGRLRAAMNGRVVAVLVREGDRVAAGQPMVTLEAMKMEHVHAAPCAGVVAAVAVAEGEQVTTGRIVVEIEPEPKAA